MGYDIYFRELPDEGVDPYYRQNIWGMGRMREAMETARMGYWSEAEPISWPDPDDYSDNDALEAALEPILSHHPDGGDGVPLFKLCTNDGWIITPPECEAAWSAWTKAEGSIGHFYDTDTVRELKLLAEYLRAAAKHGGARVY